VIIAQTEELEAILKEDAYYPDRAEYEIREFIPKMVGSREKKPSQFSLNNVVGR